MFSYFVTLSLSLSPRRISALEAECADGENDLPYTSVAAHTFPMTRDRRTRDQKLADELCYHLWRAAADTEEHQEGREAKYGGIAFSF